jgi:hypothetical protein
MTYGKVPDTASVPMAVVCATHTSNAINVTWYDFPKQDSLMPKVLKRTFNRNSQSPNMSENLVNMITSTMLFS